MNIKLTLNSYYHYTVNFLKRDLLSSLTAQQKKVLIIATIAFGFLTACYLSCRYFFHATSKVLPQIEKDKILDPKDDKVLDPEEDEIWDPEEDEIQNPEDEVLDERKILKDKKVANIFYRFQHGAKVETVSFPPDFNKGLEFRLTYSHLQPLITQVSDTYNLPHSFVRKIDRWESLENAKENIRLGDLELNHSDPHYAFYTDFYDPLKQFFPGRTWLSIVDPKKGQVLTCFDTLKDIQPHQLASSIDVHDARFTARFPHYNGPEKIPGALEEVGCYLVGAHSLNEMQIITVTASGILRKWDITQPDQPIAIGSPIQLFEVFAGTCYTHVMETYVYGSSLFAKVYEDDQGASLAGIKSNKTFLRQYDIQTGQLLNNTPLSSKYNRIFANKDHLFIYDIPESLSESSYLKAYKKDTLGNLELAWEIAPLIASFTIQVNDQWIAIHLVQNNLLILNAQTGETWWKLEHINTSKFQLLNDLIILRSQEDDKQSLMILHLPSKQKALIDLASLKLQLPEMNKEDCFQLNLENGEILALFNNSYEDQKRGCGGHSSFKEQNLLKIIPEES